MEEISAYFADFTFEPWSRFTAGLMVLMALARGLDFLSTWIVTPTLQLEANLLMRRLSWSRMGLLNLPLLGLPLLHHGLSITFIVTSLLVAGSNLSGAALAKGMGEKRHLESQAQALRQLGLFKALCLNSLGALVSAFAGGFIMTLAQRVENNAWWAGLGVLMYGVTGLVHLNLGILRLHKRLRGKGPGSSRRHPPRGGG